MHPARFERFLRENRLPLNMLDQLASVYQPIAEFILQSNRSANHRVFGINGCQGSGKSTLCKALQWLLNQQGRQTAILSIDDLYLDKMRRALLAERVHPLLETRGVPGTHDVALGIRTLRALRGGKTIPLPRFDKAIDNPYPYHRWPTQTRADLILFEGWCVASLPQSETDLREPINRLEAEEDCDGKWRAYVNNRLAGPYRALFKLIDCLMLLEVTDFSWVYGWRKKQEDQLRQRRVGNRIMDDGEIARFIQHFERITRHNMATLPPLADIRLILDPSQHIERYIAK
uniref:D-glycerate 3-kinase n=1 Tax=Candidatus Kentrum sp. LPFa TaxID=2126335 RepID=A0A450W8Y6_9GAMM|nr:MAG: D-glycerate 3-kinase [Candidatus Kentron sp. LPFa]VFK26996.1 MAG: D-glycerate 3-kinase [Candidatus Kentron sp. LPFa]